jgi:two-component system, OmpR family, response regulator
MNTQAAFLRGAERIILMDEDPVVREVVGGSLVNEGYDVETVADGRAMLEALARRNADLVLLDVRLPELDGLSICRKLARERGPCVVIHSAMTDLADRIVGLELGADDYVTKPANPREIIARVRAVLRRRPKTQSEEIRGVVCEFEGWTFNMVAHELHSPAGDKVDLTYSEFALLRRFTQSPRRVLRRDQLRGDLNRAVDVQVCRLRRKLTPAGNVLIRTVRNEGYIFVAAVERPGAGPRQARWIHGCGLPSFGNSMG